MMKSLSRLHGRRAAKGLFAISLLFSLFTAFRFDLSVGTVDDIFNPVIHAKDLLARKLADATQLDTRVSASFEWESSYDRHQHYRECVLNQPRERPQHGCVTDQDTKIPYCQVRNLRIETTKVSGPPGGEPLETVMGRNEDIEIPKYLQGAFSTPERLELAPHMSRDYWFYLLEVFMAMDVNPRQKCDRVLTGISLIITRYEYVDLYHTLKDWWNAFMSLPEGVDKVARVIFLDSHAEGSLDSVWKDLFGPTIHIKMIEEGTCLEQAIFVPPGYSSVLSPLGRLFVGNRCAAMSQAFVEFVVKSYGLEGIKKVEKSILILDQVKHIEHPRSAPEDHFDNSVLFDLHAKLLDQTDATNVQVVDLQRLSFRAQLKLIRQAHIMIGYMKQGSMDGSQLALLMFLRDGANMLEIRETGGNMQNVARWRPDIKYIPLYTSGERLVDYEIVPNVKDILTPGWDVGIRRFPDSYYEAESERDGPSDDPLWEDFDSINEDMKPEYLLTGWYSTPNDYELVDDYRACALYGPIKRPSHGCVVDPDTKIPFCEFENLRIDSSKIESSSGGEDIESVLGREEIVEFPNYLDGALSVEKDIDISGDIDRSMFYYLDDVLSAIATTPGQACVRTVSTPTLFITRYEYVDFDLALSDLWNAFMVSPDEPKLSQVVFLDGHAQGFLDSVWDSAFMKFDHVKQLQEGGICYKRAIFIPPGYSSTLTPRKRIFHSKPCPSMTAAFVNFIVKAHGLEDVVVDHGRITLLDRVPSVLHPRSNPNMQKRKILNLDVVAETLMQKTNATEVEIVDLTKKSFRDQLAIMRRSHIVMGHAEAGISQLIFMQEGTHVFEFGTMHIAPSFAKWKHGLTCRVFDDMMTVSIGESGSNMLNQRIIEMDLVPAVNYAVNREDELNSSIQNTAYDME